jgi:beta-glucanase (GH16 family)
MDRQYGRYSERFRVVHAEPGFKSAHLFYRGGHEIDFPENDYTGTISAYVHPGGPTFGTAAKWSDWHTTEIEWMPGALKFRLDGAVIGTATQKVPDIKMSWILQNESSIMGPYAAPGASAQLDIAWVSCYAPDHGPS